MPAVCSGATKLGGTLGSGCTGGSTKATLGTTLFTTALLATRPAPLSATDASLLCRLDRLKASSCYRLEDHRHGHGDSITIRSSWSDRHADGADKASNARADTWTLGVLGSDGCSPVRTGVCGQVLSSN